MISTKILSVGNSFQVAHYIPGTKEQQYDWTAEQVSMVAQQLIGAFLKEYESQHEENEGARYSSFRVGAISVKYVENEALLAFIDGHQLFVTLALLFICIHNRQGNQAGRITLEDLLLHDDLGDFPCGFNPYGHYMRGIVQGVSAYPPRRNSTDFRDIMSPMLRRSDIVDPGILKGSFEAKAPRCLSPQLLTLSKSAPEGESWLHRIKHDGFRMTVTVNESRARLWTRNSYDWTSRLPSLARALEDLGLASAVLDGELVCLDEEGRTDFAQLQLCVARAGKGRPLLYLFDLVHFDGWDLTRVPLIERKKFLCRILDENTDWDTSVLRFRDHVVGGGDKVYAQACHLGLEGIVSKQMNSSYLPGRRSRSWLKIKNPHFHRDTVGPWRKH